MNDWLRALFDRVDAMDTDGWLQYLSEDAQFRFGNAPPRMGETQIRDTVDGFFSTLSRVSHDIDEVFELPHAIICRGEVTYTRLDGSGLSVPFANVLKLDENGLIRDYLIYADTSGL